MASPKPLEFKFKGKPIRIDTGLFTIPVTRKMNDVLGAARAKYSNVFKHPMNPGETEEEWKNRLIEEGLWKDLDDNIRRDDEDEFQHAIRINKDPMDAQAYAFDIVNGLASLFSQPMITEDEFEDAHWPSLRTWLYNVYSEAGIKAFEYSPKSR